MKTVKELWAAIGPSRPIVFWGAAMTGQATGKMIDRFNLRLPSLYVDSSSAFLGRSNGGIPIRYPNAIWEETWSEKPYVVVTVAVRENEIADILQHHGFNEGDDYSLISALNIPLFLIDIVGACNLRCPSCPRGNSDDLPQPPLGMMSVELFTKIVDRILEQSPYVPYISLYNWGDTLLHPKLSEIVKVLTDRNIFSAASSNFSMEYDLKSLVRSGLGELKISLSGFYQDTYGQTHTKGDIRLVKSNMYRLRYYMDKFNSDLSVKVEYHVYRDNRGRDFEMMKDLCEELGFAFNSYFAIVSPVEKILSRLIDGDKTLDDINDKLAVSLEDGIRIGKKYPIDDCNYYNQTNINVDGSVYLCCNTYNSADNMVCQDFLNTSLDEINLAKRRHPLCGPCIDHGLPQFIQNLGAEERAKLVRPPTR